jgi:hypothetical protein
MKDETQIEPIIPTEREMQRLMEVRFDCIVKMFDSGFRTTGGFLMPKKDLPPQWFKSNMHLTLEAVKEKSPYELGYIIKNAFNELQKHIEQYENKQP